MFAHNFLSLIEFRIYFTIQGYIFFATGKNIVIIYNMSKEVEQMKIPKIEIENKSIEEEILNKAIVIARNNHVNFVRIYL